MAARKKGEVKTFEEGMALLSQVVDQLETNQTGTIQMTWDNGEVHFIEN